MAFIRGRQGTDVAQAAHPCRSQSDRSGNERTHDYASLSGYHLHWGQSMTLSYSAHRQGGLSAVGRHPRLESRYPLQGASRRRGMKPALEPGSRLAVSSTWSSVDPLWREVVRTGTELLELHDISFSILI